MPKKVYELAKELGVASKELLEKAAKMGIEVQNHMSVLSDTDVKRLSAKSGTSRPAGKAMPGQVSGRVGPMGRPIVNDSYFENRRKAPAGKPIVDSDFLAKREKVCGNKAVVILGCNSPYGRVSGASTSLITACIVFHDMRYGQGISV